MKIKNVFFLKQKVSLGGEGHPRSSPYLKNQIFPRHVVFNKS